MCLGNVYALEPLGGLRLCVYAFDFTAEFFIRDILLGLRKATNNMLVVLYKVKLPQNLILVIEAAMSPWGSFFKLQHMTLFLF